MKEEITNSIFLNEHPKANLARPQRLLAILFLLIFQSNFTQWNETVSSIE